VEREQLEHLIRAAAQVTHEYEFIIVGSQSILGPVPHPHPELKVSMEADMYPRGAPEKADLLDGQIGEGSWFHITHKIYAQGVGPETAVLPSGWETRLHKVQTAQTDLKIGYCLDVLDLFMSKAWAGREKDREFCITLLRYSYVHLDAAVQRVADMPLTDGQKTSLRARIRRWARHAEPPASDKETL
jgi:hypothetical protein